MKEKYTPLLQIIFVVQIQQLISKFNKGFRFLLCAIDIYSNYAWIFPLKDKKGITFANAFQKILKESNRKPNKYRLIKVVNFTIDQ